MDYIEKSKYIFTDINRKYFICLGTVAVLLFLLFVLVAYDLGALPF